ncbi:hypothetical protein A2U01_0109472, partial [Trifolium medium]|nr:hypothetical protein [Trifolium medium]
MTTTKAVLPTTHPKAELHDKRSETVTAKDNEAGMRKSYQRANEAMIQ